MLVLAMEFSRCAQRARRATIIKEQTDERVQRTRARGRPKPQRGGGFASEGRNRPGLLEEQGTEGHSLKTE
jgi:hypothetical protein